MRSGDVASRWGLCLGAWGRGPALSPVQAVLGRAVTLPYLAAWRWTQTPEQPTSARQRTACTSAWLCWPPCWAASRARPSASAQAQLWAWDLAPPTVAVPLVTALGHPDRPCAQMHTCGDHASDTGLDWSHLAWRWGRRGGAQSAHLPSCTSNLYSYFFTDLIKQLSCLCFLLP